MVRQRLREEQEAAAAARAERLATRQRLAAERRAALEVELARLRGDGDNRPAAASSSAESEFGVSALAARELAALDELEAAELAILDVLDPVTRLRRRREISQQFAFRRRAVAAAARTRAAATVATGLSRTRGDLLVGVTYACATTAL